MTYLRKLSAQARYTKILKIKLNIYAKEDCKIREREAKERKSNSIYTKERSINYKCTFWKSSAQAMLCKREIN